MSRENDFINGLVEKDKEIARLQGLLKAQGTTWKEVVAMLCLTIEEMQAVTEILGAGVKHIATPDGFFGRWNEAERRAKDMLRRHDRRQK